MSWCGHGEVIGLGQPGWDRAWPVSIPCDAEVIQPTPPSPQRQELSTPPLQEVVPRAELAEMLAAIPAAAQAALWRAPHLLLGRQPFPIQP